MKENQVIKCKNKQDVIDLISFFEMVFLENNTIDNIKKISESKKKIMTENLNNKNYFLYFIKQDNKIISGIYAYIIDETMYLDVIAVDKKFRNKGLSKILINYILNQSKSLIKEIIVIPSKYNKDKSFDYYIHTGYNPILFLSSFENIDFEKYNKYKLKILSNKLETFNDNGNTRYYNTIKYFVDNPLDKYIYYYESISNIDECYYIFVKK